MSLMDNDIELIEKYIDNNLSEEEREFFNLRLKDNDFLKELKLYETAVQSTKVLFLKEELKEILKTTPIGSIEGSETKKRGVSYLTWAAVVFIAVVAFSIFFLRPKENTTESLFNSNYKPYPVAFITRDHDDINNHPAFEQYNEANYGAASDLLKKEINKNDSGYQLPFLQLLLGNCYLNTNKIDSASITFQKVMVSKDHMLRQHAEWYLALTLIKAKETKKASDLLREIKNSKSIYSKQASSLEKDLDKVH